MFKVRQMIDKKIRTFKAKSKMKRPTKTCLITKENSILVINILKKYTNTTEWTRGQKH